MSLEKKAAQFAREVNIEAFENSGDITTFRQIGEVIEKIRGRVDKGTDNIVRNEFEAKIKEYEALVSDKPPMFKAIFEVGRNEYCPPIREAGERITPFLNRSQELLNQLNREVETVRKSIRRIEKLDKVYEKKEEFKKIINDDLERQRVEAIRTTVDDVMEAEKVKLQLPNVYLSEIVNEVIQEKIEKEEYETENGAISPIIKYRGKRINAGRIYGTLKSVRERGTPFRLTKGDVLANLCNDFDTFAEWLGTVANAYNMKIDRIDATIYGERNR